MSIQNVSIVLSPTMRISHRVLNVLFLHSKELFAHVKITRYENLHPYMYKPIHNTFPAGVIESFCQIRIEKGARSFPFTLAFLR